MLETEWENAVKVHEGCGGICYWQEAIETLGVLWEACCMHCHADQLAIEDMIPIERRISDNFDPDAPDLLEAVRNTSIEEREQLEWVADDSWDQNQDRLRKELDLRRPGAG